MFIKIYLEIPNDKKTLNISFILGVQMASDPLTPSSAKIAFVDQDIKKVQNSKVVKRSDALCTFLTVKTIH